jgi:hypothetical protein
MKTNKGFTVVPFVVFIVALLAVGGGVYYSIKKSESPNCFKIAFAPGPNCLQAAKDFEKKYPGCNYSNSCILDKNTKEIIPIVAENIIGAWIDYFPSNPNDPTCEFAGDGYCAPNNAEIMNFYPDYRFISNKFPSYKSPEDFNCKWDISKDVLKVNCSPDKLEYKLNIRIISLVEDKLTFIRTRYAQNQDGSFSQLGDTEQEETFLRFISKDQ